MWVLTPFCIFTFWIPLLVSFRATNEKNSLSLLFLLTYWLFYVVVNHACNFVHQHVAGLNVACLVSPVGSIINMWMFYSHGCLISSHYYVPLFFGRISGFYTILDFDRRVLTPLLLPLVEAYNTAQSRLIRGTGLVGTKSCSNNQTNLSFLEQQIVNHCYVDESSELHARYMKTNLVFGGIFLVVKPTEPSIYHRESPRQTSRLNGPQRPAILPKEREVPQCETREYTLLILRDSPKYAKVDHNLRDVSGYALRPRHVLDDAWIYRDVSYVAREPGHIPREAPGLNVKQVPPRQVPPQGPYGKMSPPKYHRNDLVAVEEPSEVRGLINQGNSWKLRTRSKSEPERPKGLALTSTHR